MRSNLVAEMVRKGYKADQVPKVVAQIIKCSEKTARNKIKNITDFTFTEIVKIDDAVFKNEFSLKYLFQNFDEPPRRLA